MSMIKEHISLLDLQNINYQLDSALLIRYQDQTIICDELLRIVPKKRLVFKGKHLNKNVIIKLFIHHSRAKKHWQRECQGADLLKNKQILSPNTIARGLSDEGIYFIIFAYIKGQSLAEYWKVHSPANRKTIITKMLPILEQHHHQGLAHQDLHYGNFFLAEKKNDIYTLDGEEVKQNKAPLNLSDRLTNLALFLAQTFDLSQSFCLECLETYLSLASLEINEQEKNHFWKKIKVIQQQRIDQYLKKILRDCTEVIFKQQQRGYSLCRREHHSPAIQQLLDQPEQFFQDENSIYLKQGNTCTVKSVLIEKQRYVVKRYNPKGLVYNLSHIGQTSRAKKSWINAHLLRFMSILTPEPIALLDQYGQMGKNYRYFISKQIDTPNSWTFFCDNPLIGHEIIADELLSLFNKLGEYHITHGDLKGSNFLIQKNKTWLIDLDGLKQHKTPQSFNKIWLKDKQRFMQNWEKKNCYEPWKNYFKQIMNTDT